jgi:hypothetical protein
VTTNTTADIATRELMGAVTESVVKFLPLTVVLSLVMVLLATFVRAGADFPALHPVKATLDVARIAESIVRHAHDALGWATFASSVGAVLGLVLIFAWG